MSVMPRLLPALALLAVVAGCAAPAPPTPPHVRAWRTVGAWQGAGNSLVGNVNSETGQFRFTWESRPEAAATPGRFRLIVRSAVSGRPLEVIADEPGGGRGMTEFTDAPRIYDFEVDATGVQWSLTVEEAYAAVAPRP